MRIAGVALEAQLGLCEDTIIYTFLIYDRHADSCSILDLKNET